MPTPSPWIGTVTGLIGAACGISSVVVTLLTYTAAQPRLIVDIASDFRPPPDCTAKSMPCDDNYQHDMINATITIPCTIINLGEKSEFIRHAMISLLSGTVFLDQLHYDEPFKLDGKHAKTINAVLHYYRERVTSNDGILAIELVTATGKFATSKHFEFSPI
jgi:hypothetical protein